MLVRIDLLLTYNGKGTVRIPKLFREWVGPTSRWKETQGGLIPSANSGSIQRTLAVFSPLPKAAGFQDKHVSQRTWHSPWELLLNAFLVHRAQ